MKKITKLNITLLFSLLVCQNSSTMNENKTLAPLPQTVNNLNNDNNGIPQEVIWLQAQQERVQRNQNQQLTEEEQMEIAIAQSLEESIPQQPQLAEEELIRIAIAQSLNETTQRQPPQIRTSQAQAPQLSPSEEQMLDYVEYTPKYNRENVGIHWEEKHSIVFGPSTIGQGVFFQ